MRVSVVIPTFNRAHRLHVPLESVFAQTYQPFETIVIDDGSTDGTREVVANYGSRVTYVHQANAGCGPARNAGIEHATGDCIAFLDSDDRWHDFKLAMQVALMQKHPDVGLVFSQFAIEKPDGSTVFDGCDRWAGRRLDFPEMVRGTLSGADSSHAAGWPHGAATYSVGPMYRQLLDEMPILTSSVMVRRSMLDASMRYANVKIFEDWEFFAQVARRHAVGYLDAVTAVNVGHDDPGRVSSCDPLTRALSYRALLERVWPEDDRFESAHPGARRSAKGRALHAIARQAVLNGRPDEAKAALREYRSLGVRERAVWTSVYGLCAGTPGGRNLLRGVLVAHSLLHSITGRAPIGYPVRPQA